MLETLQKYAMKSYITRIIISIIIIVAVLVGTKFALIDVIMGGVTVDFTSELSVYEGRYVTMDVDCLLSDYVEHTETTTENGSTITIVEGDSYAVFNALYDEEMESAVWYYYSIYAPDELLEEYTQKIEDCWDYLLDESNTVEQPDSVRVQGTWTVMTEPLSQYYLESLEEMGIEEGLYDVITLYMVDPTMIGGVEQTTFWILMAAALIALVFLICTIVGMCNSSYKKYVTKLLQKNNALSMNILDSDFGSATKIGKKMWIGRRFTIWMNGCWIQIVENEKLVWGYYYRRTGRHSVSQIRLHDIEKSLYLINISKKLSEEALEYYGRYMSHMVIGYTKDLEKCFDKQFDEFLNLKYRSAEEYM